jgi:hypothetical protein
MNQPKILGPEVQANWLSGPRTSAWDNLWQHISTEVLANHETPNCGEDVEEVDIDA